MAARIDARLSARWQQDQIEPAPLADDAEFLRRACLDITGRIPRSSEVYAFLADASADKRARVIERLLDDPRFAIHFANVWRAELLPEATTNGQARELERGFENWLRLRFKAGVRYDQLVRDVVAAPLPPAGQSGEPVLRDPERQNPLAFIAAKNASPENLATAVTRTFLGIRLECAQCHDHPFANWSQVQFWSQAAFFGGLKKQTSSLLSPLTEKFDSREIASPRPAQASRQLPRHFSSAVSPIGRAARLAPCWPSGSRRRRIRTSPRRQPTASGRSFSARGNAGLRSVRRI